MVRLHGIHINQPRFSQHQERKLQVDGDILLFSHGCEACFLSAGIVSALLVHVAQLTVLFMYHLARADDPVATFDAQGSSNQVKT